MIAAIASQSNDPTLADRTAGLPKCPRTRVRRGEKLHGVGDPFHALYVVRVGFLKSLTLSDGGLIQVTGFPMEGDVIGLDAICVGYHQSLVVALDDAEVFKLPFAQCEQWSQDSPYGQRLMMRTLALEIVRSKEHIAMLGAMYAEQKMATFLLDLSDRYGRRGYSRSQFLLRMTRRDIGSYLGLKVETVSRMLTRFQQEGLIQVQGKSIALLDFQALWRMSGISPSRQRPVVDPIVDREGELMITRETSDGC